MSTRNRQKRAAKQQSRRRAAAEREQFRWRDTDQDLGPVLAEPALVAAARCPCGELERHADELLAHFDGHALDLASDAALANGIRGAWEAGWTPADIAELARRSLPAPVAGCLHEAIVIESRRYAPATLHPRWHAAVTAIAAGVEPDLPDAAHLRGWGSRNSVRSSAALVVLLQVLCALDTLPMLERLLPLPGAQRHTGPVGGEVDRKVLVKVRALLAKAESTEFPDEAEALSAKAQELMSRYSLHHAVAEHERGLAPSATGRRLWMDAPYPGAKVLLVQAVATANRCRTVWREDPGFVTVVGPDTELDIVELLTTSLLLQASRAMLAAGRQITRNGTSRTRSFRQAFLVAYASRVRERLTAATSSATAEAQAAESRRPIDQPSNARLLPVLAARSKAADEMMDRLFPAMVSRQVSVSNAAGWTAGRAAADLAQFDVHNSIAG